MSNAPGHRSAPHDKQRAVPRYVPSVVRSKARVAGALQWLSDLPDLVARIERDWSVTVGRPYETATEAFVASAASQRC